MDKLRLMRITAQKLAGDKKFLSYYLTQNADAQHKTETDMMTVLNCDPETYYKLALCQAPEPQKGDYTDRLLQIAGYTNLPLTVLDGLIKNVLLEERKRQGSNKRQPIFLRWISTGPFYRLGFSALSLVFLMLAFTARVDTHSRLFYSESYPAYKDSVNHMCLCDNTCVKDLLAQNQFN